MHQLGVLGHLPADEDRAMMKVMMNHLRRFLHVAAFGGEHTI